jgi:riboflavin kinase / FMN adenylyltransferase
MHPVLDHPEHEPPRVMGAMRAVAIGTFDGVHRGHQAVIRMLARTRLTPTVVTFDPHPRAHFGIDVPMITTVERRVELLHAAGAHDVVVVPFSAETAAQSPHDWIDSTLVPLGTQAIAVGSDFRFGRDRAGTVATLRERGFEVHAIRLVSGVSSTEVRRLVGLGHLAEAARLLGRPFSLSTVIDRAALTDNGGATLFLAPSVPGGLRPPAGVYWARIDGMHGIATLDEGRVRFVTPDAAPGWRRGLARELALTGHYGRE